MHETIIYAYTSSPLGKLLLTSDGRRLSGIYFPCHQEQHQPGPNWRRDANPFDDTRRQLDAYFAGKLAEFDVPLAMNGTPFEKRVWDALRRIAYGTTVSYRDIAQRIGQVTACRAVGLANGRNPIPIIVPCHRVIGADGSLTGYGGGLDTKRYLLELEGVELRERKMRRTAAAR
ncbi:MAG: methylated-DNA--[protein]-cysteine S-methyltransferase [Pirellulales bacterium]